MSTSCCLMRCSSRSSGPSNFASLTGYASRIDSKLGWYSILEFHRAAHAFHRLLGDDARLARTFVQHITKKRRARQDFGTACADGIQLRVQRFCQLRLHLDIADLAGTVSRLEIVNLRHIRI